MHYFRQISSLVFVFLLSTGFKCTGSGNSSSASVGDAAKTQVSLEAANVRTETAGPQLKGLLRFRLEQLAAFYIDRLDENTVTGRVWDWEHEPKPRPAEEMTVAESISNKDDSGNYISTPVVYIEITGMTCPPPDNPELRCNEPLLKVDDAFIEKLRKDGAFRARLGKMLGTEITVDKNNPVFRIEDVK